MVETSSASSDVCIGNLLAKRERGSSVVGPGGCCTSHPRLTDGLSWHAGRILTFLLEVRCFWVGGQSPLLQRKEVGQFLC